MTAYMAYIKRLISSRSLNEAALAHLIRVIQPGQVIIIFLPPGMEAEK
jgi:hypothetical protein